jgi:4-oxalocrotonate tautomerase
VVADAPSRFALGKPAPAQALKGDTMPLVRIDLRKGKDTTQRQEIGRIVHEALVSVGVPKDDRFQVISEHDAANFVFDPNYLDIRRTGDLVIIQITWNEGRTVEQKKALYKAIADGRGQARPAPRGCLRQPRRGQT